MSKPSPMDDLPLNMQPLTRMRWIFLTFLILWIALAMCFTAVVFYHTNNIASLTFGSIAAAPIYMLHRVAKYLFPRDKQDFQLKALKIIVKGEKRDNKKHFLQQKLNNDYSHAEHLTSIADFLEHKGDRS